MAEQRIIISSKWGQVAAELATNDDAKTVAPMMPLTIEMDDHLLHQKTRNLASTLPVSPAGATFQGAH